MKVIFYRHSLFSRGGDKMTLAYAGFLAEQGLDVEIRVSQFETIFPIHEKIDVVLTGTRGKIGTLWYGLTHKLKAEIVIADIIPLACLLFIRNRKRVVYFAQDYDESYYAYRLQQLFIRLLYRLGLILFQIPTIVVSHALGTLLQTRFRTKVFVVPNGIDTSVFFPEKDEELMSFKGDRKAIVILSRSDKRKGFDIAQETLQKLFLETKTPFVVWSVGEPCEGMFSGLSHHHFGYVGEERLRKIFSSADLFLYPSRHEGYGLMAVEALACGCPLVTTEAVPVVTPGVNAMVSSVDDFNSLATDIGSLIQNPDLAGQLVRAAFLFVEENTLMKSKNIYLQTLLKIYQAQNI